MAFSWWNDKTKGKGFTNKGFLKEEEDFRRVFTCVLVSFWHSDKKKNKNGCLQMSVNNSLLPQKSKQNYFKLI